MNPKEEIYTPGEPHYYARRPAPPTCPSPGRFHLGTWFRDNKPQAMTFVNLAILLPLVFFLYPFLLEMADQPAIRRLGPLQITSSLTENTGNTILTLKLTAEDPSVSGVLEMEARWGEIRQTFSYFYSAEMSVDETQRAFSQVFPTQDPSVPIKISCRWGDEFLEWEETLPLNN